MYDVLNGLGNSRIKFKNKLWLTNKVGGGDLNVQGVFFLRTITAFPTCYPFNIIPHPPARLSFWD